MCSRRIAMKRSMRKIVPALLAVVVLAAFQRLLEPKYMGRVVEGAMIKEYYRETMPHDLLILGDCEVYENISPVKLWEEYGITSYIRGSANQLPVQSYYLLEDSLRSETPKAVLWNVAAMTMEGQDKEAYNRMTMEGMRWSPSKWNAIRETKLEGEHMIEYLFPLLRYHSRWKGLEVEDLTYYWGTPLVTHNGYYMRCDVREAGEFPAPRRKSSYEFSEMSWRYLERMRGLCEENGIILILMKAPTIYPVWEDEYEEQIKAYAREHRLLYLNCLKAPVGLDYSRDTYDGGMHLNLYGAEKLSCYLGGVIARAAGLADHRGEAVLAGVWEEKLARYYRQRELQEQEFETLGYLKQFSEGEE